MDPRQHLCRIGALLLGCILLSCSPPQPPIEVPITAASEEARQLYIQARDHMENVEFEKGTALLDRAIRLDPEFALAYVMRSQSGLGPDAARENREKANALSGKVSRGERLLIQYVDAQANGRGALGKLYLDTLLSEFPKDKHIHFMAGYYYRALADYKNAVAQYEQAVKLDSAFAPAYNVLGYDNMALGNAAAAEQAFRTYIRLAPARPNPIDSYAEFLRMSGRYDESIQQYQKVLAMDSMFIGSLFGIGDCYLRKDDPVKARESYKAAIDRSTQVGDKLGGYYSIATTYVHEGKIADALNVLEQRKELALKEKRSSEAVWSVGAAGTVMSFLGDPAQGVKRTNESVELAKTLPMADPARENMLFWSNFWLVVGYGEAKNLEKANEMLAVFERDVKRRGNPGEADQLKVAQGFMDTKEGRYDAALEKLAGVPEEPFVLYLQAFAQAKKGDKEKAGVILEKLSNWRYVSLDQATMARKALALKGK
jgi:tetratricopeptide (TPR) repeat protein